MMESKQEHKGWLENLQGLGSQKLKLYFYLIFITFIFFSFLIQPKERSRKDSRYYPIVIDYVAFTENNYKELSSNGKAEYTRPYYKTRYDMIARNIVLFGTALTGLYLVVRIKE